MQAIILASLPEGSRIQQVGATAQSKPNTTEITKDIQKALVMDEWFQANQKTLSCRAGLAWKGTKVYVPKSLQMEGLQRCHDV